MLHLDTQHAQPFLADGALDALQPRLADAHAQVLQGTGAGSEFLGWRDLLSDPNDALLEDIETTAAEIRHKADVLVCIGIGGSYLGAKAVIDALTPYLQTPPPPAAKTETPSADRTPEVLFAGHHMSGAYMRELLQYLEGKSVYLNVISKSGTTLEPALSFRFLRQWLEATFDDADNRIIITTDPESGALNELRKAHPYKKYEIPRNVGGRFSVLTPVGLLPIAVAGIDIRSLFYGAVEQCKALESAADNPALMYAGIRYLLHEADYAVDTLAVFEPRLSSIGGWWQQLFGESEGKEGKGLFPASVQYSTDLHSLGQYVQDGQRFLLETFLLVADDGGDLTVPDSDENLDGLNYLSGKTMQEINRKAYEGTRKAHVEGGVPVMTVTLDAVAAAPLGAALYFFEHAVAVSGYLLEVNPFNQPGVEAYKKEMFSLLGKPS